MNYFLRKLLNNIGASSYPGSLDSFTTKTDKVDDNAAADMNDVQNAIVAMQTEAGTDVAGDKTDLKTRLGAAIEGSFADVGTRLAHIQDADGAIAKGTSFPVSGLVDGQYFYRTDENAAYIYNGSTWDLQGQSLSNVIFSWSGVEILAQGANSYGMQLGTNAAPDLDSSTLEVMFLAVNSNGGYRTLLNFRYTHLAGISTATLWARSMNQTAAGNSLIRLDIGSQTGLITVDNGSFTWDSAAADVSGLTPGTTYDGIIEINNSAANVQTFVSAVTVIAS